MNRLKDLLHRATPALAALVLFFVAAALYFAPQFSGERLPQHDTVQYEGMSRDIKAMRADTGEDPQWTGAMFGGMPAYLINIEYPAQLVVRTLGAAVRGVLETPAAFLVFAMLALWLALVWCGVDPWLAIVPAVAYGFSTYFPLIIGAGHVTKMWALVYAPLMMAGAWLTLRGPMVRGAVLTAVATSLEIGANHPQITYYFLLAMALFWISEGVAALRAHRPGDFLRRTGVLAAAGVLAVLSNFAPLWYTAQHTKDTIRGGSELAVAADGTSPKGLALDYATAWSYGRAESWNLLVPDFAGRDSGTTFARDGEVAVAVKELGLDGLAEQLPAYWGGQPYTAGPTYLGAAAIFLAVLGALLASGRNRWWVLAASLWMLLLAWGRNWMAFTEFFFDYLPGYDKFRTVSMALVVVQWSVPLLGGLGLCSLLRAVGAAADGTNKRSRSTARATEAVGAADAPRAAKGACTAEATGACNAHSAGNAACANDAGCAGDAVGTTDAPRSLRCVRRALAWALGLTGGACLLLLIGGGALFSFGLAEGSALLTDYLRRIFEANDLQTYIARGMDVEWGERIGAAMAAERLAMMRADAGRSLLMVLLAAGCVWLFLRRRIGRITLAGALTAVMLLDLVPVDLRFLSHDDFVSPARRRIAMTEADRTILADKTLGFRVLNRTVSPFNDATTSYFHRSVGGYHGAKLARYQDLIDRYLNEDHGAVLDMLDTRYVILPDAAGRPVAKRRTTAFGPAWFVDEIHFAPTAEAEIDFLGTADLRRTAVVAGADAELFAATRADTSDNRIELVEYRPNYQRYTYDAATDAVALFSEIYYDKGWHAYIDGEEAPYVRADYVLRAMELPAGSHTVEWRFRAPDWGTVEAITLAASLTILLGALALLVVEWRRSRQKRA